MSNPLPPQGAVTVAGLAIAIALIFGAAHNWTGINNFNSGTFEINGLNGTHPTIFKNSNQTKSYSITIPPLTQNDTMQLVSTLPTAKVAINGQSRSSFTGIATTNATGNNINNHIQTVDQTHTGTIADTNSTLTGTFAGTLGALLANTFSYLGHIQTIPNNSGTILDTNGTLTGTVSSATISGTITGNPTTSGNWIMSGVEDFGYMADKFGSGSILVRNPASTQATAILNSAQTHNRTATLPLTTGNTTIAMQPIFNFTSPGNKTGTSSVTPVMLGAFATLTPRYSGNVTVIVTGYSSSGTLLDGCKLSARYSTSSLGANGAALAGTGIGSNLIATSPTASANIPFEITGIVTGLTPASKEYFDLSEGAAIGGTCTVFNVNWNIREQ